MKFLGILGFLWPRGFSSNLDLLALRSPTSEPGYCPGSGYRGNLKVVHVSTSHLGPLEPYWPEGPQGSCPGLGATLPAWFGRKQSWVSWGLPPIPVLDLGPSFSILGLPLFHQQVHNSYHLMDHLPQLSHLPVSSGRGSGSECWSHGSQACQFLLILFDFFWQVHRGC